MYCIWRILKRAGSFILIASCIMVLLEDITREHFSHYYCSEMFQSHIQDYFALNAILSLEMLYRRLSIRIDDLPSSAFNCSIQFLSQSAWLLYCIKLFRFHHWRKPSLSSSYFLFPFLSISSSTYPEVSSVLFPFLSFSDSPKFAAIVVCLHFSDYCFVSTVTSHYLNEEELMVC